MDDNYLMNWTTPLTAEEAKKVEDNQGLIGHEIKEHFMGHISGEVTYPDLFQVGQFGLMEGARKWEPEKGAFSTYAKIWIRNKIRRFLREKTGPVVIPKWIYYAPRSEEGATDAKSARMDKEKDRAARTRGMVSVDEERDKLLSPDEAKRARDRRNLMGMIYAVGSTDALEALGRQVAIKVFGLDGGTPSPEMDDSRFDEIVHSLGVNKMRATKAFGAFIAKVRAQTGIGGPPT